MKDELLKEFYKEFLTLMDYNGLWCYLLEIKDALKNTQDKKYGHVIFPECLGNDCDHIANVFWAVLVLMYGNYGTSPRFGWIEDANAAIEFVDTILTDYKRKLPPFLKDLNEEEYYDYIEAGLFTEDEEIGQDYLKG